MLRENLGLKVLALVLAILLWGYVRVTQTVWTEVQSMSEIYVTAVLRLDNLGPDLMIVSAPKNVLINVRGPTDFIRTMGPAAVSAEVDLSGKPAGVYNLAVKPDYPQELTLVQMDPERVNIELDVLTQRQMPVDLSPIGVPASGYTVGLPVLQPAVVTVEGPRNRVRDVQTIKARVDLTNLETDIVQRVAVEARDDRDQLLEDVSLSPKYITVSVPIRADTEPRTVPVVASLQGTLTDGLEITSLQPDPAVVTIMVPRGMPRPPLLIKTEPIALKGMKAGTIGMTSHLVVPDGLTLLRDKDVHITLKVSKKT